MTKFCVTAIRTMRRVETYDVEAKDAATAKMTVESNHPFLDPTVVDDKWRISWSCDRMGAEAAPSSRRACMRDPIEAACTTFLAAEFDELGSAWFHPSERANFVHNGRARLEPKMRAAVTAYLKAVLANSFGAPPLSKMIADVETSG